MTWWGYWATWWYHQWGYDTWWYHQWGHWATWWYHDHLWHWWHVWHYTDGWGSLGTITVAILAILVSARYNRRTLGQARAIGDATVDVMRKQRADQRSDVLRTELARWLTVVSEIERAAADMLRRIHGLNLAHDNPGGSLDIAEIDRRVSEVKSAVRESISEPLANYATQGTQIQMLTADEGVLANMHFITQAIVGKTQNLNSLIDTIHTYAKQTPDEQRQERLNYTFASVLAAAQDYQYTRQINASRSDLINHVMGRFNPAAVETVARVNRKYPNVLQELQPMSIIRPQPQSQPMGAEPTGHVTGQNQNGS
ncbi:hypothetical protein FZI85_07870 [Mycobacterium sp. CBMA293]|uniref:hypothetical protein n=1 Tax=unclassified Mycolicibacterium TaxID=2636767 RepID=UPI0012DCECBC|nr:MULTISPECIES: hypothetical protein [unclassified Mycolicibacterium]MUL46484.1 hypothetical protein [Mycolicibacterium sp. CBMA 360]MUL57004.1 hypothetical protein [Mycolicibacterium sp. CBMA 335]MUL70044.1 hypothetical protein [Mycolicibacterium sp. CBMA 311]MUL92092.1 hypothetical protein [Mycolicibacterium sp. CBMA 230]MUM05830.1 hypothetical protein [Mycolicibacterium sp. CBMA 213]